MRYRVAALAAAAVLAVSPAFAQKPQDPLRPAIEAAIERVRPSLVRIRVVWTDYSEGREVKREVVGSGFVIDPRGYVVTNHHVAGHAASAVCTFADNHEVDASLVGADPLGDIAVLKLAPSEKGPYPIVEWGDSSDVAVGDVALAMGSPLALSQSVTRGIVSNLKMTMPKEYERYGGFTIDGEAVGSLVRWVGHDSQIFPGNSGGPLVDLSGRIVGVNEISVGLAGAIPADLARGIVNEIIKDGRVRRSWLGIEFQPTLKSSPSVSGALVAGVIEGSPAGKAGLLPNDVVTSLDGDAVTLRFDEDMPPLMQRIAAIPIGKQVSLDVRRGDRQLVLKADTAQREPADTLQTELKAWGMTAKDIPYMAAKEMHFSDRTGVLVTSIRPGGPSGQAKPALQPGDVVKKVSGKPVVGLDDLVSRTRDLVRDSKAPVAAAVEFDRKDEQFLTVVSLGILNHEDSGSEASKPWLPIAVQAVTPEMAAAMGAPGLTGVRVTRVFKGQLPAGSDLRVADVITAIDGDSLSSIQPGEEDSFNERIRQYAIAAAPELSVIRDGHAIKISVALPPSPKLEREMAKYEDNDFEFSARDLSFFDRDKDKIADTDGGVIVTEIKSGGWASLGDIRVGDVIRTVEGKPLRDVASLRSAMKGLASQKPRFVVFGVLRGIHTRSLELVANWDTGK